jgi:glutathione synthase/RimK-type ligase-like ATP-grasp enzyme
VRGKIVTVLILSAAPDVHAQAVMDALASRGAHAELLDLAEFPAQLTLSMAFENGRRRFELRRRGGGVLDFSAVRSVWWRRPQPFKLPAGMDPSHQRFAASEAATAFQGLYQSLDANWVNVPAHDSVAAHKPYQLTLAQEIGLEIPPTLMTNDVEQARAFWRRHEGEVIYKQFIAMHETWRETRRLNSGDEAHADAIAHAPVIFQKHVPAVADLRVTAVGGRFFAAATDVRNAEYPQDVRMNLGAKYAAHDLPPEVRAKLSALMDRLGLVYGAIDLRLTPEGRYVFLEINPAGQFLYIERATGQPIAAALADVLIKTSKVAKDRAASQQVRVAAPRKPIQPHAFRHAEEEDDRALSDSAVDGRMLHGEDA